MDSSEERAISETPVDKEINNPDADNASSGNVSITEPGEINGSTSSTGYYLFAALLISFLLAGGYTFQKHRSREENKPENYKLEKSKLEKNRLSEEKPEHKTEKLSVPGSTPNFSAKVPDERIEPKTEPRLPVEPVETQLSGESDFEVREKEEKAEIKERHLMPEIEPAALELEAEEDKETAPEEPAQASEPTKIPESETPVIKKNYPLPADLEEIMDIIRGQGGRITQKDLRSKLKYSEGKVSLMLADLERRELIEKFKRGRGNVVILRDKER
jgi:uncharacterized membrane protein